MHVHLAAALADDAQDARVRDGALDGQRAVVQVLQPLAVLQLCVHLRARARPWEPATARGMQPIKGSTCSATYLMITR